MNAFPHLLLLHGALGSPAQLNPLANLLKSRYQVHLPAFEGHGGVTSARPFSMEGFVENVTDYLAAHSIERCSFFGYSMGGYAALKFARHFPERVEKITTLGTKFAWSPEIALKETRMLRPEVIEEKVPKFAAALSATHAPADWKEVMRKTADMMRRLGDQPTLTETDFEQIDTPVRLLLGSEDTMVTLEETEAVASWLPDSMLHIVQGWQHPIERVEVEKLAGLIS